MKRAGYWISEKKSKKQNFEDAKEKYREAGIELVKIDLNVDFEVQGPFDLIIHKTTDLLVKADLGDRDAINITKQFKDYASNHPNCIMLDPMENVYRLLDRYEQYNIVADCIQKDSESDIFIPSFAILLTTDIEVNKRKLHEARVTYPIVVKPILAHGTRISHQMSIVFNEKGLRDILPPCVAQRFVNHNAVLYKVFVIGNKQFIVDRPSLKNFHASDNETIFFDTHDVSKADSSHMLNELDASDQGNLPIKPDIRKLEELGEALRSAFGLDLLGVDVIIDCVTKRYGVIDINAFPGYDGNNISFFDVLLDHMLTLLKVPRSSKVKVAPDQSEPSNLDSGRKTNANSDDLPESCIKRLKSDPSSGVAVDCGFHNHPSANNNMSHYAVNGSPADHRSLGEPCREFPVSLHGKSICNGHAVEDGGERPQT